MLCPSSNRPIHNLTPPTLFHVPNLRLGRDRTPARLSRWLTQKRNKKIGIVLDKNFCDKRFLKQIIFDLKSETEQIIGIDNREYWRYVRKFSDDFEIDYTEILPSHYQWTTRSLISVHEHNKYYNRYSILNYTRRAKTFADQVDRVLIFADGKRKLNKNTLYLIQELDRKNVDYEIVRPI